MNVYAVQCVFSCLATIMILWRFLDRLALKLKREKKMMMMMITNKLHLLENCRRQNFRIFPRSSGKQSIFLHTKLFPTHFLTHKTHTVHILNYTVKSRFNDCLNVTQGCHFTVNVFVFVNYSLRISGWPKFNTKKSQFKEWSLHFHTLNCDFLVILKSLVEYITNIQRQLLISSKWQPWVTLSHSSYGGLSHKPGYTVGIAK